MNEKKYCIVDRLEGDFVVVEYGKTTFDIPKSLLKYDVKEGDVIDIIISINYQETKKRKKRIEKLSKGLFKE